MIGPDSTRCEPCGGSSPKDWCGRSSFVEADVLGHQPPQMVLIPHDYVIEAFAALCQYFRLWPRPGLPISLATQRRMFVARWWSPIQEMQVT